jgi:hypothetical protein
MLVLDISEEAYTILKLYFATRFDKVKEELEEHPQLKNRTDFYKTLAGMSYYLTVELVTEPWHHRVLSRVQRQNGHVDSKTAGEWMMEEDAEKY